MLIDDPHKVHINTGLNIIPETNITRILEWLIRHPQFCVHTDAKDLHGRLVRDLPDITYSSLRTHLIKLRNEKVIVWTGYGRHKGNYIINLHHSAIGKDLKALVPKETSEAFSIYHEQEQSHYKTKKPKSSNKQTENSGLTIDELIKELQTRGGELYIKFIDKEN